MLLFLLIEELQELLALRKNLASMALRESIANGNYEWEAQLLAAHHRLVHHAELVAQSSNDLEFALLALQVTDETHVPEQESAD